MASEEEAFNQAKALLGEHYQHYAIVVQYDDGSVWHEGNNELVSRALYEEALTMIKEQREWEDSDLEIDWEEDDDDDWKVSDCEE
jgi:hypothetical protein|tara:strand:- start:585 stop:839 length:255 start_codon:yes stop_codon:yes gene_type:complete